jgi:type IV pilus biogenesis/stability protein PilW
MPRKKRIIFSLAIVISVAGTVALLASGGFVRERGTALPGRENPLRAQSRPAATTPVSLDLAANPTQTEAQKAALEKAVAAAVAGPRPAASLKIDYPFSNSLFPPDMVAPMFLFHDQAVKASLWLIDISTAGGTGPVRVLTDGRRPKKVMDPRCGAPNEDYQEPEYQTSAKGWTPSAEIWRALTEKPETDVTITISGLVAPDWTKPVGRISLLSRGSVVLRVSKDPVGAPIMYRDVPLLPTSNEKGLIQPLPEGSLPLIEWRLRDLSEPSSTLVLKDMPTCANCHSFSKDGKYLGMDMDGPNGDKGAYAMAPIVPKIVIEQKQVYTWNEYDPNWQTFGLFSRVSPDGRYVVSSVEELVFVKNFMDIEFLQTFYPTQGILAFYDRLTGKIKALPGADDLAYVHCNAVWTPDGKSLVYLQARARSNVPVGPPPLKANDPHEVQIQYDLYTIPFNEGRGGRAVPIPGASDNGKSNSFPKVSPDGKWLVWVEAQNGLLMRPDSELYIMPMAGGRPRRMTCNMSPMNSWHSWSPNGRWLVFSSKANRPYTQMFLTHVDEQGNDSPAVLIPNSTADNRAVNLPEFVNVKPQTEFTIDAPAVDYRRFLDRGTDLIRSGKVDEALPELQTADKMRPNFAETQAALGYYFRETGDTARAAEYFEKALALDHRNWSAHNYYGVMLFREGRYDAALKHFQAAVDIYPLNFQALTDSGAIELSRGNFDAARAFFKKAIEANPDYGEARFNLALIEAQDGKFAEAIAQYEKCVTITPDDPDTLGNLAWLYATCPEAAARNGRRALELAQELQKLGDGNSPHTFDVLAAAYAETGQFPLAVKMAEKAVALTVSEDPAGGMRHKLLSLYKSGKPYHGEKL